MPLYYLDEPDLEPSAYCADCHRLLPQCTCLFCETCGATVDQQREQARFDEYGRAWCDAGCYLRSMVTQPTLDLKLAREVLALRPLDVEERACVFEAWLQTGRRY